MAVVESFLELKCFRCVSVLILGSRVFPDQIIPNNNIVCDICRRGPVCCLTPLKPVPFFFYLFFIFCRLNRSKGTCRHHRLYRRPLFQSYTNHSSRQYSYEAEMSPVIANKGSCCDLYSIYGGQRIIKARLPPAKVNIF